MPGLRQGPDVVYDYELAASHFKDFPSSERPQNIWHFEELLPIVDARAQARVGQLAGYTPLIRADRLGAELGLTQPVPEGRLHQPAEPLLQGPRRLDVRRAAARARQARDRLRLHRQRRHRRRVAGREGRGRRVRLLPQPPGGRRRRARAWRSARRSCQVEGNYDEANRRCREVAEATGMEFANITLRPFYAEGAKTAAFEIVEQLDWDAPEHIVTAAAGGTLSSRMHKGLGELQLLGLSETDGTRIHIAQPSGCNPIASAILAEEAEIHPVTPETAAHSLAIGAPGDGYLVIDAVHKRGGTAAFASDPEIFAGIDLLAATEGLLTEPAGGTTIAVLEKLAAAGRFAPDDTVVAMITGNGLKTLDEHPPKQWPAKIDCEAMLKLGARRQLAHADGARAAERLREALSVQTWVRASTQQCGHRKAPPERGLPLASR